MIITREIINKNIKFHDISFDESGLVYDEIIYGYSELSNAIDLYKNLLIESGVKPQETITIAEPNGIWQIAALFASFELGLKVAITDYFSKIDWNNFSSENIELDSKTMSLMPIDYVCLPKFDGSIEKIEYLTFASKKKIVRIFNEVYLNKPIDSKTYDHHLNDNLVATKSATSGSTGFPKCIEHNHEFLYSLLLRNSSLFYDNFVSFLTFNHGSSIFCYAIPSLASKEVVDYYQISNIYLRENFVHIPFEKFLEKIMNRVTHFCSPYQAFTDYITECAKTYNYSNMIIHVLSYIKENWVKTYNDKKILDVISNFGSNETTGPIFINQASNKKFSYCEYSLYDNFFSVEVLNQSTKIYMPIYNTSIYMNDIFEVSQSGKYVHKGRSDLIRINDHEINTSSYDSVIEKYFHGILVPDIINSEIYLAIWKNDNKLNIHSIDEHIRDISSELLKLSFNKHYISKYSILNYDDYLGGIKLDMEKLREYFRNPDGNYKKLNQK